jgi:hypothetical protein
MPALLEAVPRSVSERLFAKVKRQVDFFLQSNGIHLTIPKLEAVLDRTISRECKRFVASSRQQGKSLRLQDAATIYSTMIEPILRNVATIGRESLSGVVLNISTTDLTDLELTTMVAIRDGIGGMRSIPAFFFVLNGFRNGDYFEKAGTTLVARRLDWSSCDAVDLDWKFLWSLLGDRAFCRKYWDEYVAVFNLEVLGRGGTDPAARDAGILILRERGESSIPPERFVVDFVGNA